MQTFSVRVKRCEMETTDALGTRKPGEQVPVLENPRQCKTQTPPGKAWCRVALCRCEVAWVPSIAKLPPDALAARWHRSFGSRGFSGKIWSPKLTWQIQVAFFTCTINCISTESLTRVGPRNYPRRSQGGARCPPSKGPVLFGGAKTGCPTTVDGNREERATVCALAVPNGTTVCALMIPAGSP